MKKSKLKFDSDDNLLIEKFFREGYKSFTGFEQARWLAMNIYNDEFKKAFEKAHKENEEIKDLKQKLNTIHDELYNN